MPDSSNRHTPAPTAMPYVRAAEITLTYADGTTETLTFSGEAMKAQMRIEATRPAFSGDLDLPTIGRLQPMITMPTPHHLRLTVTAPTAVWVQERTGVADVLAIARAEEAVTGLPVDVERMKGQHGV